MPENITFVILKILYNFLALDLWDNVNHDIDLTTFVHWSKTSINTSNFPTKDLVSQRWFSGICTISLTPQNMIYLAWLGRCTSCMDSAFHSLHYSPPEETQNGFPFCDRRAFFSTKRSCGFAKHEESHKVLFNSVWRYSACKYCFVYNYYGSWNTNCFKNIFPINCFFGLNASHFGEYTCTIHLHFGK